MGDNFWVAKISNIFLGSLWPLWLEIPYMFFGGMVDAWPEPTYEEKMRVHSRALSRYFA